MRIGVPKEIKVQENRVSLTPDSVRELTTRGHRVLVETMAGAGSGCMDEDYVAAGADIAPDAGAVYAGSDLIVKVKEPLPGEIKMLREGQTVFAFLHLAPNPELTKGLLAAGCTAIAYETITNEEGRLPLLVPMSAVAGRLAIQIGAHYLEKPSGGAGVLLGGAPGVDPAKVVILGVGTVGTNALDVALALGADVTVINSSKKRLAELRAIYRDRAKVLDSTPETIADAVHEAYLIIGAALVPGAATPELVTREMVRTMHPGSVAVDVAIDQGGCFETSRVTTHDEPTFVTDGVIHYCVANMPGAVPRTSTFALNAATLPFVLRLADLGPREALARDPHLRDGLNVYRGHITHKAVAEALGYEYQAPDAAIGA